MFKMFKVILETCCGIVGMFYLEVCTYSLGLGLLFDLPFHFLPSCIFIYQFRESLVHLY